MRNVTDNVIYDLLYVHIKYLPFFYHFFHICRDNKKLDLHKLTSLAREIEDKSAR